MRDTVWHFVRVILWSSSAIRYLIVHCALLGGLMPLHLTHAQAPRITEARLGDDRSFLVRAQIPAGYGHVVLEFTADGGRTPWRPMIGGPVDGRAATVSFHLPAQAGVRSAMVRVKSGAGPTPSAVELDDPALLEVIYPDDGDTRAETAKVALLDDLGAYADSLADQPTPVRRSAILARALSSPAIRRAGVSTRAGNLWIEYQDGDIALLVDNRPPPQPGAAPALPPPPPPSPRPRLPVPINAACGFTLEQFTFENSAATVHGWLNARGYSSSLSTNVTVDQLLSWQNLAVFFWQAHAGGAPVDPGNPQNTTERMAILTGQQAGDATFVRFRQLRTSRQLLLAKPIISSPVPGWATLPSFYAVTGDFVRNNMRFSTRSVVAIDACTAADPDLASGFLAAGAGVYVSWNALSCQESGTPFRQFFDRLLGQNAEEPKSTPKERPFPVPLVREWMQEKGYDLDPGQCHQARLVWYFASGPVGAGERKQASILRPSINRVLHEAGAANGTHFLLEGFFAKDADPASRRVAWGDRILHVDEWEENFIRVSPPPPPYPSGDIEVIVGARKSNPVPMTEWVIPFSYKLTGKGSLECRINMTIKLRSDARTVRSKPEESPQGEPSMAIWTLHDSTGIVEASGSYKPNPDTTVTWSGGSTLGSAPLSPHFLHAAATLSPTTSRLERMVLIASGEYTVQNNASSTTRPASLDGFLFLGPDELNLRFDPNSHVLQAGSVRNIFPVGTEHGVSAELKWPAVTPTSAPTDDTPR
jgi:hypothetical protein